MCYGAFVQTDKINYTICHNVLRFCLVLNFSEHFLCRLSWCLYKELSTKKPRFNIPTLKRARALNDFSVIRNLSAGSCGNSTFCGHQCFIDSMKQNRIYHISHFSLSFTESYIKSSNMREIQ